jgi:hypothetical protein
MRIHGGSNACAFAFQISLDGRFDPETVAGLCSGFPVGRVGFTGAGTTPLAVGYPGWLWVAAGFVIAM